MFRMATRFLLGPIQLALVEENGRKRLGTRRKGEDLLAVMPDALNPQRTFWNTDRRLLWLGLVLRCAADDGKLSGK